MMKYLGQAMEAQKTAVAPTRRSFLKMVAGTAGAGFVIGMQLPRGAGAADHEGAGDMVFTPFIKVMPDNSVQVISKHLDMGQGSATGLATLVADELDASIDQVGVDFAPSNVALYKNFAFGAQGTGGSTAIANSFQQYRAAGATARAMFVAAAAQEWGVPVAEIRVEKGVLSHASGKTATFGDLVKAASGQPVPEKPTLKKPQDWVYIGKHFPRVDSEMKSTGSVDRFAMDFQPENLLVAVVARPPRFGATVKSFDATEAKKVRGVVDVIQVPQGVAVLATSTWPAIKGRRMLTVEWDDKHAETRSSDRIMADFKALAEKPGVVADNRGDVTAALGSAAKTRDFTFEFPYLAHAAMEPLNVTVRFDGTNATIWTGSQLQTVDHNIAAEVLGVPPKNIQIVTKWAGGSFGRRAVYNADYVAEAATVARTWGRDQPIKVVWTREDDMTGGYYRPMNVHKVSLGFDDDGKLTGWQHRLVGQSIMTGTLFEQYMVKDGVDETSVEGVAHNTYALDSFRAELHSPQTGVPVLWWRSVGHTFNAYTMETMIDVAAKEAGEDPVAFRRRMIRDDPRKLAVLNMVAEKSGWGQSMPKGRSRGVAVHKSFGSYVAEVAEISMNDDGEVKVEKVWCVVDCGMPVNPDNIVAQMEGGIGFGLGAILRNEITLTDGKPDQENFDSYLPLRMEDMPEIEVHIMPSDADPTGVGEPGVPPIGPAVANAVFAATGDMPTRLPFTKTGLAY